MAKKIVDEDLVMNIIVNGDQGKKELGALNRIVRDTTASIDKNKNTLKLLEKQGKQNSAEYKKLTAELKTQEAAVLAARNRIDILTKGMKICDMSLADLAKRQRQLNYELRQLSPNSPELERYKKEIAEVSARMDELKGKTDASRSSIDSVSSSFNKYAAIVVSTLLGANELVDKLEQAKEAYTELEGGMSDVIKTTGLTRDDVRKLNEELSKLDTRTSQQELLDLASVAGKLGVSGVEDVEKFVAAADKIVVALKNDLGGDAEDAVNAIGKLTDLFGLNDAYGVDEAMLKVGSAINTLGAASTANEGYIVNFSKKIGGTAKTVGLEVDEVLALGATLDTLGQNSEVSATAISRVLMGMFDKTSEFAKIAGMDLEAFSTLLETDVSSALISVLDGLGRDGIDSVLEGTKLVGLTGVESVNVLSALAGNVDSLRSQMGLSLDAFESGSSIIAEFNVKNNDQQALMEKAQKKYQAAIVDLGEKAIPILENATKLSTLFIQSITWLIDAYGSWGKYAVTVGALLMANNVLIRTVTIAIAMKNKAVTASMINTKTYITLEKGRMLLDKAALSLTSLKTAATHLYSAALLLMQGKTVLATRAMVAFSTALRLSPVGLIVTAVVALGAGLVYLCGRLSSVNAEQRAFNDLNKSAKESILEERAALQSAYEVATNENLSRELRNKAISKLQSLLPNGIDLINAETIASGKAKEAVDAHISALYEKAQVVAANKELERIAAKEIAGYQMTTMDKVSAMFSDQYLSMSMLSGFKYSPAEFLKPIKDKEFKDECVQEVAAVVKYMEEQLKKRKTSEKAWSLYSDEAFLADKKQLDDGVTDAAEHKKQLLALETKHLKARMALKVDNAKQLEDLAKLVALNEAKLRGLNSGGGSSTALGGEDEELLRAKFELKKRLRDGDITSTNEYNRLVTEAEITSLNKQLDNTKLTAAQRMKIEEDIFDKRKSLRDADLSHQAAILAVIQTETQKENSLYESKLKQLGLYNADRSKLTENELKALEVLEREHDDKVEQIENKTIERALALAQNGAAQKLSQLKAAHDRELLEFKGSAQEREQLLQRQAQEEEQLVLGHLKSMQTAIEQMVTSGVFNSDDTSIILSDEQIEMLRGRVAIILSELRKIKEGKGEAEGDDSSSGYSFEREGSVDVLGMTPEDWQMLFENLEKGKVGFGELVSLGKVLSNTFSLVNKAMTASENRTLANFEKSVDAKKDKLQEQLESGVISQDEYNSQVEALDKELDAKKLEIERKQAARNKISAMFDIGLNTAVAVTKVLPNWVLAAIVAAAGAAQMAIVAATPLPGYESGGVIGVTREQDGRKFNARLSDKRGLIGSPSVLVAENGPEVVLNNDFVRNPTFEPLMHTLLHIQESGAARDFNFATLNLVRGYQSGGVVSSSSTTSVHGSDGLPVSSPVAVDSAVLSRLVAVLENLERKGIEANVDATKRGGFLDVISRLVATKSKNTIK